MSLTLSPEFSARIQAKLAGSGFTSPEQMLERALEALELQQQTEADFVQSLEESSVQLARGEGIPHDEVWSKLEARLRQRLAS